MVDGSVLEAVKLGLKGELDSVTIYSEAFERSSGEVAVFFADRVAEEKRHYNWLLKYYNEMLGGTMPNYNLAAEVFGMEEQSPIVTADFLKRVGESQYLVTAVASAALLEANAVKHYRAAAEKAGAKRNAALRDFFNSLAGWEEQHYEDLMRIQEESRQHWFDAQNFEPF